LLLNAGRCPQSRQKARQSLAVPHLSHLAAAAEFETVLPAKQQRYATNPGQARRRLCSDDLDILRDHSAWVSRIDERHAHPSSEHWISISAKVERIPIAVSVGLSIISDVTAVTAEG
jgi:hypothetical protein